MTTKSVSGYMESSRMDPSMTFDADLVIRVPSLAGFSIEEEIVLPALQKWSGPFSSQPCSEDGAASSREYSEDESTWDERLKNCRLFWGFLEGRIGPGHYRMILGRFHNLTCKRLQDLQRKVEGVKTDFWNHEVSFCLENHMEAQNGMQVVRMDQGRSIQEDQQDSEVRSSEPSLATFLGRIKRDFSRSSRDPAYIEISRVGIDALGFCASGDAPIKWREDVSQELFLVVR